MPLEITLRTRSLASPFRDRLLKLCSLNLGNRLILCSGYFQEHYGNYSILGDQLLQAIQGSATIKDVELRGIMGGFKWSQGFKNFGQSLLAAGFQVTAYQAKSKRWHAKIAIRMQNDEPIAAIIGSSNLTRPPYGIIPSQRWNYECDVTIWKNEKQLNDVFRGGGNVTENEFIISTDLAEGINQPDESSRLKELLLQIRGAENDFRLIDLA